MKKKIEITYDSDNVNEKHLYEILAPINNLENLYIKRWTLVWVYLPKNIYFDSYDTYIQWCDINNLSENERDHVKPMYEQIANPVITIEDLMGKDEKLKTLEEPSIIIDAMKKMLDDASYKAMIDNLYNEIYPNAKRKS